jgi:DNA-binding transcriptional LysR family regulator
MANVRQDQLDGLVVFVCVAEAQGFSAAAARLGVSPSAVSQAIRQLEKRVGVPLFNRTTRSISLTEAGSRFLQRVAPAVQELALASEELVDTQARPSGLLRLNVSRAGYMTLLQPLLGRFLDAYPEIELELSIDNMLIDIVGPGFDAGIRFGHQVARDMVGIPVGPRLSAHLVASPAYLAAHGTPTHPRELLAHQCIGYRYANTGMLDRWDFEKDGETIQMTLAGRLTVNDSAVLVQAALDGIGIAYMINGYIERLIEEGRLVRVLADWSPPQPGFTLYYPDRRRVSARLRALIDFLRAERVPAAIDVAGALLG